MRSEMVAPIVVIAINLYLVCWALLRKPRTPAYWAFAALGFSLIVWNVGGLLQWYSEGHRELHERLSAAWLRLSFVGALLAPANVLFVSLLAGGRRRLARWRPGRWIWLTYVPAVLCGAMLDLDFVRSGAMTNSWRRSFYDTTDAGALVVVLVVGLYALASMLIVWPDRDADPGERKQAEVIFRGVLAPFLIGVIGILVMGVLRDDRAPTAAFWMMFVSQVAMFQMVRLGWVELEITREKSVILFLVLVTAGAAVMLISSAVAWLCQRRVRVEAVLVMTVSLVTACYIFAASLPGLEALAGRIASRGRRGKGA